MSAVRAEQEDFNLDGEDIAVAVPTWFRLASGDALPDAEILLRRYGRADAPTIVVAGGISAGRFLSGARGWWGDIVAAGAAIDLERYSALGFDFSPIADARVRLTPLDQARLVEVALNVLNVAQIEAWVGASYGGMVGLSFAAHAPARIKRLCAISAAHRPSALARGWRGVQRRVVEFAIAQGAAEEGLSLARQLAMITYRSADEFEQRFPGGVGDDCRSDLDRYLIARGDAYIDVMAPQRWLTLSEAIDRCDVTPEDITVPVTLAACPTDQIATFPDMEELARRLPRLSAFYTLPSLYGHDAFLKEPERVSAIVRACLELGDVV
ncbi:MAG: alpha/beta fold hydrolase [Hyphomonadaceae bacterium]